MKVLPRPEGFDLRFRRANQAKDATLWLPEDALYAASNDMKDPKIAVCVAWYEKCDNDNHAIKYRLWQEYPRASVALATDMMVDLSS